MRAIHNGYTFLLNQSGTVEVYNESVNSLQGLEPIFIGNKSGIETVKDFETEVAYILYDFLSTDEENN